MKAARRWPTVFLSFSSVDPTHLISETSFNCFSSSSISSAETNGTRDSRIHRRDSNKGTGPSFSSSSCNSNQSFVSILSKHLMFTKDAVSLLTRWSKRNADIHKPKKVSCHKELWRSCKAFTRSAKIAIMSYIIYFPIRNYRIVAKLLLDLPK